MGIEILKHKLRTLLSIDHFWTNFGHVSHIPVVRFDVIAHAGAPLDVECYATFYKK